MTNELLNYRQIFDSRVNSDQSVSNSAERLKAEFKLESIRILNALHNNILCLDPLKAKHYISHHQQSLSLLLDETYGLTEVNQQKDHNKKNIKEITEIFLASSENLLLDLQKYFPDYFSHQSTVPQSLSEKTKFKIDSKISHLIEIASNQEDQKEFLEITENMLIPILSEITTFTYQAQDYLEHFLEKLTSEIEKAETPMKTIDILLLLISLNFNHPDFYHYCCRYFIQETDKCEELATQHSTLTLIKKHIVQTFPLTDYRLGKELPPIKESLLTYLDSELDYLSSMDNIGAQLTQHGLLDNKYKVTFTVKQLAIFIHLQVEANIIVAETPKLLHEYIAKHYSTNETNRISAKSFKNAYYSASTEDLEKVIDKIVTMLAIAQEKL
jgi:hypothetical protein